jgi:flagellar biosynthesis/type III secretory pathway M-ring protein FliF/YscJ
VLVDAHGRQHVVSSGVTPGASSNDVVDGTLEDLDDSANLSGSHEGSHDDLESHQLFRRVRDMAQERPDDAARTLRSWIYQQD